MSDERCHWTKKCWSGLHQTWEVEWSCIRIGGVGVVVKSSNPRWAAGDLVQGGFGWPWQLFFVVNVEQVDIKDYFQKVSLCNITMLYSITHHSKQLVCNLRLESSANANCQTGSQGLVWQKIYYSRTTDFWLLVGIGPMGSRQLWTNIH